MPFEPFAPEPDVQATIDPRRLVHALRHPETWPPDFEWDYGRCPSCAMGLAWRLTGQIGKCTPDKGMALMRRSMPMPNSSVVAVFLLLHPLGQVVNPEDVAAAIEAVIGLDYDAVY